MRIEKIGVVITDKKGNVIKEFESVLQAAKYVILLQVILVSAVQIIKEKSNLCVKAIILDINE